MNMFDALNKMESERKADVKDYQDWREDQRAAAKKKKEEIATWPTTDLSHFREIVAKEPTCMNSLTWARVEFIPLEYKEHPVGKIAIIYFKVKRHTFKYTTKENVMCRKLIPDRMYDVVSIEGAEITNLPVVDLLLKVAPIILSKLTLLPCWESSQNGNLDCILSGLPYELQIDE